MKVIPNVEELKAAMDATSTVECAGNDGSIMWDTWEPGDIYDALPDAPLPAEVAAAVAKIEDYRRAGISLLPSSNSVATVLRALAAREADVQRLREAILAYQKVAEQAKPRLLGDDPDVSTGVAYEFTTEQDNDLIEAEARMKAALA